MVEIKETFKERLEKALDYRRMKPVELARMTGISEATISQYRSGYSKPKDRRLVMIANALHVDPAWLMGVDVPMNKSSAPIYEAAAGEGRINDGYPTEEYDLRLKPDQILFEVKGRSMEPTLLDGDVVVISAQSVIDHPRQIALVKVNGEESTLKRVEIKENGLLLLADNVDVYAPHFFTQDEVEKLPVTILGVVDKLIRSM